MGSKVYFADFQSYKLIYFLNVRRLSGLSGKLENNPVFGPWKPGWIGLEIGWIKGHKSISRAETQRRRSCKFISRATPQRRSAPGQVYPLIPPPLRSGIFAALRFAPIHANENLPPDSPSALCPMLYAFGLLSHFPLLPLNPLKGTCIFHSHFNNISTFIGLSKYNY